MQKDIFSYINIYTLNEKIYNYQVYIYIYIYIYTRCDIPGEKMHMKYRKDNLKMIKRKVIKTKQKRKI